MKIGYFSLCVEGEGDFLPSFSAILIASLCGDVTGLL